MRSKIYFMIVILLALIIYNFIQKINNNRTLNHHKINNKINRKKELESESESMSELESELKNESIESCSSVDLTIVSISIDEDDLSKFSKIKNHMSKVEDKEDGIYKHDKYDANIIDRNVSQLELKEYLQKNVLSGRAPDYDNDEEEIFKNKTKNSIS